MLHSHFTRLDRLVDSPRRERPGRLLLSEDMHDGFSWNGVTVTNPFAASRHPLLAALLSEGATR